MIWRTASKWTGRSTRESARYKLESEREGNPKYQKDNPDSGLRTRNPGRPCNVVLGQDRSRLRRPPTLVL